jgi:hypothetical protein
MQVAGDRQRNTSRIFRKNEYRQIIGTTPSSQRMCSAETSGEEGNKMRQFGTADIPQENLHRSAEGG